MKESKIKTFFLLFLLMFTLSGCGSNTKTVKKISNNEITATGEFEEGTTLAANKITIDSEEYNELNERVNLSQFDGLNLAIYDFSLEKDGKTVEPKKDVTITLPKPFMSPDGFETYHVKKDNNIEKLDTKVEGGNISFTTASFSTFIITGKAPIVNPIYNFLAYADTETQGKIIVNKEEKVSYAANLEAGDEVVLTALPNNGYEFVGWYKGSKISGSNERYDEYKDEAYITFNGEKTEIYARFMPIEYEINYELNGGVLSETPISTYTIESSDYILPIPTKQYYQFDGWKNKDTIVNKISKGTTGDITLIATWTQKEGLMRTIEITKEVIGEIELGTDSILTSADYQVRQNDTIISGEDLKDEDGIVTIEYKLKSSSDDTYSSTIPTELGEYVVRVRISQSKTDPYYNEAVSSPKEFSLIERVIKTKFNVLGNYHYDKYKLGTNQIVKYEYRGANVLELDDVVGGEKKVYGYQNTEIPLANLVFEQYAEKYTEIRIGSKDGIAIGRLVMYGVKYFSWSENDKNGQYIRTNSDYFYVCTQGEALDTSISRVAFEFLPNVTGYTDSEGNWISEEKNLDVYTFTHYTNDNPKQKNIGYAVNFDDYRYNNYEDNPALNQLSYVLNDASYNVENAYYRFEPRDNLKYDVEISGDVEIYNLNLLTHKITKVEKQSFMTICHQSQNDTLSYESKYVFVLKKGAKVTVYNGKAFKVEKINKLVRLVYVDYLKVLSFRKIFVA